MKYKVGDIIVIEKSIFADFNGQKGRILKLSEDAVVIKFLEPKSKTNRVSDEHEIDYHKIRHLTKLEKALL